MSWFRPTSENVPRQPSDFITRAHVKCGPLCGNRPIIDLILAPQTPGSFLAFATIGTLPTGEKTGLRLLPFEIVRDYLTVPYSKWAPGPHDVFGVSPLQQTMCRIASKEDSSRLQILEKGVHEMKSRLWEDIMPVSEERWRQKRLNDPAYHHLACRYIGQVIEVFSYLQHPTVLKKVTQTFGHIQNDFRDFDRVVNGLETRAGEPPVQVAALWEAFLTAHYTVMATRAHSWVLSKLSELKARDRRLLAVTNPPPSDTHSDEQITILNRIHDFAELTIRADYTIFLHMPSSTPPLPKILPALAERRQLWLQTYRRHRDESWFQDTLNNTYLRDYRPPPNASSELVRSMQAQIRNQDAVRHEFRGIPRQLPAMGWITTLKKSIANDEGAQWGFTAYRLTYQANDEEWASFVEKLEADLNNWGEGLEGASDVKSKLSITWIDGRERGVDEDDIEGAKTHFSTLKLDEERTFWYDKYFLAIDTASYDSYIHGSPFSKLLLPGDTGGFVTAVYVSFDPDDRDRPEESPFYTGRLRILGNLVYCDLYAMLVSQCQSAEELWPLAICHPELIYCGPTVKKQVERWKKVTEVKMRVVEMLGEWVKARGAAAGVS